MKAEIYTTLRRFVTELDFFGQKETQSEDTLEPWKSHLLTALMGLGFFFAVLKMVIAAYNLARAVGILTDRTGNVRNTKFLSSGVAALSFVFLVACWAWYIGDIIKVGRDLTTEDQSDDLQEAGYDPLRMEIGSGCACAIAGSVLMFLGIIVPLFVPTEAAAAGGTATATGVPVKSEV